MDLREAALNLAGRRWPVFPIQPRGKKPLTAHGLKDATTNQATINEWWAKWPSANVAIATGHVVVLDVDPRHGGDEALKALEAQHGPLPETLESATGGGGRHLFFKHDGLAIRNSAGVLGPGLDVRGFGGYVIAPPSMHESGTQYRWTCRLAPAPLPQWMKQKLTQPPPQASHGNGHDRIPEGQRNATLTSLAGTMRKRGLSPEAILAALLAHNQQCCLPPLAEHEVRTIASSVSRYPAGAMTVTDGMDGAAILDHIVGYVRRFVSLSEAQARSVALWVVHTHAIEAADATPYLAITSKEKQSGKTRTLEALEPLVRDPWLTGRVTAAVLIRKIDKDAPTLLLDESDAAFNGAEEYAEALRGVLNTGHRAGGKASCCVGQGANIGFKDFSTFCPKAIAGIGRLPGTVADRAIPIRLKRASPGERIERFRAREVEPEASGLREQIAAWATKMCDRLRSARPQLPQQLSDRQQDGAEPLLAIADEAGGDWPRAARAALVDIFTSAAGADESIGVMLLADIKKIFFESKGLDRMPSAEMVGALAGIETSPWAEWKYGKAMTAVQLAGQLRGFGIRPDSIRVGDRTIKGYMATDFADAWMRYLRVVDAPCSPCQDHQSGTPEQAAINAGSSDISRRNTSEAVPGQKVQKTASNGLCSGVPDQTQGHGQAVEL